MDKHGTEPTTTKLGTINSKETNATLQSVLVQEHMFSHSLLLNAVSAVRDLSQLLIACKEELLMVSQLNNAQEV